MISIETVVNGQKVNKKYYRYNTDQTRYHYIETLRVHFRGKYHYLDKITKYKGDFITRGIIPYDDEFYFELDEVPLYGFSNNDDHFYEYTFDVHNLNLTLLFTKDDYDTRREFVSEVMAMLRKKELFTLIDQLMPHFENFRYEDNLYLSVDKHKFNMRKEDR